MNLTLEPGHQYSIYPVECRGTADIIVDGQQHSIVLEDALISNGHIIADEIIVNGIRLEVMKRGDRQVVVLPTEEVVL